MEVSKFNNRILITIEDDLLNENLSSNSRMDEINKSKDLGQIFTIDNK